MYLHTDHLSFAEVCVNCTTSVAVERNSKRMIPILHSTVERMEQRLELPDPVNYHWEQRSIVISSESDREQYLRNAWYTKNCANIASFPYYNQNL